MKEPGVSPDSASPKTDRTNSVHEAIRRRAEEIYISNGKIPGRDLDNWAQAEREILQEAGQSALKSAIVVDVNGVQYVGEYRPESSEGYQPGEFSAGVDVSVRFQGKKMFVRRPNGKELETSIVQNSIVQEKR